MVQNKINNIILRIGKPQDSYQIAMVHYECAPNDFICTLGMHFLKSYYRILLSESKSVIVCAEKEHAGVIGFLVATLDAAEHLKTLRKKTIRLFVSALPILITKPNLILEVIKRRKAASIKGNNDYVVTEGAHLEFWGLISGFRKSGIGEKILRSLLITMYSLGTKEIRCEVDYDHIKVAQVHIRCGARIIREFDTPDNKKRMILEYKFDADTLERILERRFISA
ncbi:MAG: hypothetical protein PHF23_00260 [Smithellaceae bacterium]|nr:hypothetical protein [Smithellaceae bacterium]